MLACRSERDRVVVGRSGAIDDGVVEVEQLAQFDASSDDEPRCGEDGRVTGVVRRLGGRRAADAWMCIPERALRHLQGRVQQREDGALRSGEIRFIEGQQDLTHDLYARRRLWFAGLLVL